MACTFAVCNSTCSGSTCTAYNASNSCSSGCSCGRNCSNKCSSCYGTCSSSCGNSSSGSSGNSSSGCSDCSKDCSTGCKTSCKDGCTGTCTGTCTGKCTGSCQIECNYGCISSSDMSEYRKLTLNTYINSSNINIIYNFIIKQLQRLNANTSGLPKDETGNLKKSIFKQYSSATKDDIKKLIDLMNMVKVGEINGYDSEQDLFTTDKIVISQEEMFIDDTLGNQIIENARKLFNTKIIITDK